MAAKSTFKTTLGVTSKVLHSPKSGLGGFRCHTNITPHNNIWTMAHLNMSFKDLETQGVIQTGFNKGKRDHLNGSDLTHYQHDICNTM